MISCPIKRWQMTELGKLLCNEVPMPMYDPKVLEMCVDGRIALEPFVETRPMSQIEQVFDEAHHGKLKRRVILTPDF
jgi:Zn-dependent alcohol dehydrogenase